MHGQKNIKLWFLMLHVAIPVSLNNINRNCQVFLKLNMNTRRLEMSVASYIYLPGIIKT